MSLVFDLYTGPESQIRVNVKGCSDTNIGKCLRYAALGIIKYASLCTDPIPHYVLALKRDLASSQQCSVCRILWSVEGRNGSFTSALQSPHYCRVCVRGRINPVDCVFPSRNFSRSCCCYSRVRANTASLTNLQTH